MWLQLLRDACAEVRLGEPWMRRSYIPENKFVLHPPFPLHLFGDKDREKNGAVTDSPYPLMVLMARSHPF